MADSAPSLRPVRRFALAGDATVTLVFGPLPDGAYLRGFWIHSANLGDSPIATQFPNGGTGFTAWLLRNAVVGNGMPGNNSMSDGDQECVVPCPGSSYIPVNREVDSDSRFLTITVHALVSDQNGSVCVDLDDCGEVGE